MSLFKTLKKKAKSFDDTVGSAVETGRSISKSNTAKLIFGDGKKRKKRQNDDDFFGF